LVLSRRHVVTGLSSALAAPLTAHGTPPLVAAPSDSDPEALARDESFWRRCARQYRVSDSFTNLENGYYGIMPDPVLRAFHGNVDRLNQSNSYLLRTTYKTEADAARARIAALAGVAEDEIALTGNGAEALHNLIGGYNRLRPGDAVMYADLDYHSMQYAMNWLRERRGVDVVRITIPEPATRQAVLDTYAKALRDHPRVRLLLLTHMNNRTGLVLPVRELVQLARGKGVDTIVDAAHSWAQLDYTIPDLGADFAGVSLHKWLNAPLGTGFLYIRRGRLADIDRAYDDEIHPADDIRSRVQPGTTDVAPVLSVPAALDFHHALGGSAVKQARLRYLRDRWVHQVRHIGNLEILTPDDPAMYGAITSFRVTGRTSESENTAIASYLMDRHRVFTVQRDGPAKGDCVRVTPALFTLSHHVDALATALRDVATRFRSNTV
jgi:selenocysteine lyase/cysteine desulfurase